MIHNTQIYIGITLVWIFIERAKIHTTRNENMMLKMMAGACTKWNLLPMLSPANRKLEEGGGVGEGV